MSSISRFIYKGPHSQCLLFTMKKGENLSSHRAMVDAMIVAKKGVLKITEAAKERVLLEGENHLLEAATEHAVTAISDIEFYLFKLAPHSAKKDVENRKDIELIVRTFYNKVKKDALLSPVFSTKITGEEQWEKHLVRMSDFWETVLFAKQLYRGNPFPHHLNLGISSAHFDQWIHLFEKTLNENFTGSKTEEIKERAKKMRQLFEIKLNMDNHDTLKHIV